MRLFVGIELTGEAREEVLRVREELLVPLDRQGVRFVKPEKLHLTLAFLGSVEPEAVPSLVAALSQIVAESARLELAPVGAFPNTHRPKVIWIGLGGETSRLTQLAEQVVERSRPFAPELDAKPFSPHITLARISPGSKDVGRLLGQSAPRVQAVPLCVSSFCLYHSVPDGSYSVLNRIRLGSI